MIRSIIMENSGFNQSKFNELLQRSKAQRDKQSANKLNDFISKYENEKKDISEKDQFYMVMQLLECAYNVELKKTPEERVDKVKLRWRRRKRYVIDVWNSTLLNKYNTVMAQITMMNIWDAHDKDDESTSSEVQENEDHEDDEEIQEIK